MLRIELVGATQVITLDRPDRSNALHPDLIAALSTTLSRIGRDQGIHVVVITGAGKSFCAGLDLERLMELDAGDSVESMRSAFSLFRQVHELPQPVIAAVNGPAMAGGFDLAAFCDIRMCSQGARFAQTEILLGLTQIMYPVYKVIGLGRATELALTGRAIPAEEAYRIGLVSAVLPDDELLARVLELAGELSAKPPEALFETKRLSRELIELDSDTAFGRMFDVISARLGSDEHRAAVRSYVRGLAQRKRQR